MPRFPSGSRGPSPAPGWRDRSSRVDGNALAGPLAELLSVDPTVLVAVCRACGHAAALAEAVVDADDAALIVRCRPCTRTLLTVQRVAEGVTVTIGGLGALRTPQ